MYHNMKEKENVLLHAQALFNFLFEELLDDVLGESIEAPVLPFGFVIENATLYLLLLHLLLLDLRAFERRVACHHLVYAATEGPPVHRCPVWGFAQDFGGHVSSSARLEERNNIVVEVERGE